ncbi:MAG: hypothetical protein EA408_10855 [Marinilabiliales bacterium]|nr:MAG: hypothetical protein EA408_10855 [Marinilabiliales bacterium]
MLKYIILVVTINLVLFIGLFTRENVHLQIITPPSAEAGTTVEVEIELHKAGISGFARFHQELPRGIKASPVYPADMDFSFEHNTVRMIWLNLPSEETLRIRYKLHIDERLRGELNLSGTFSYIEDNRRMRADAPGVAIQIEPSPYIDENLIVEIGETAEPEPGISVPAPGISEAVAVRQVPVADDGQGYLVNILVSSGPRSSFARIEEKIPHGFTAVEVESHGGIFTFSDQTVRFIWRELSPETTFLVSYRLVPVTDYETVPQPSGEFSVVQNDITSNLPVVEREAPLETLSEAGRLRLLSSALLEARTTAPMRMPAPPVTSPRPAPAVPAPAPDQLVRPLPPEDGVYYRVQLAAGRRPVDPDGYFGNLEIPYTVHTELHEGWIKYTIGSFPDYRSARDQRVHIWNTTPVGDAFVSAYNHGTRITVQEALAIANHRWYR